MHTSTVNSFQIHRLISLQGLVKIILPVLAISLISIYAFFHFSIHHWVLLGLFTVAALAIFFRISHIDTTAHDHQLIEKGRIYSDGGALRKKEMQSVNARPVSHDGGSFERSTSVTKSGS